MSNTADPVERVARAVRQVNGVFGDWGQVARAIARTAIKEHKVWLAEQNVDVDKLLSGEKDAAEIEVGPAADAVIDETRALVAEAVFARIFTHAHWRLRERLQALDAAKAKLAKARETADG